MVKGQAEKRLHEIADKLYTRLNIKKQLDGSLEGQEKSPELFINVNSGIFRNVDAVNQDYETHPTTFKTEQDYYDATEIGIVSNEFIKHGLINRVSQRNGHGWSIPKRAGP